MIKSVRQRPSRVESTLRKIPLWTSPENSANTPFSLIKVDLVCMQPDDVRYPATSRAISLLSTPSLTELSVSLRDPYSLPTLSIKALIFLKGPSDLYRLFPGKTLSTSLSSSVLILKKKKKCLERS